MELSFVGRLCQLTIEAFWDITSYRLVGSYLLIRRHITEGFNFHKQSSVNLISRLMSFELQYSYRTKQTVYRNYFMREVNVNTDGEKCR